MQRTFMSKLILFLFAVVPLAFVVCGVLMIDDGISSLRHNKEWQSNLELFHVDCAKAASNDQLSTCYFENVPVTFSVHYGGRHSVLAAEVNDPTLSEREVVLADNPNSTVPLWPTENAYPVEVWRGKAVSVTINGSPDRTTEHPQILIDEEHMARPTIIFGIVFEIIFLPMAFLLLSMIIMKPRQASKPS